MLKEFLYHKNYGDSHTHRYPYASMKLIESRHLEEMTGNLADLIYISNILLFYYFFYICMSNVLNVFRRKSSSKFSKKYTNLLEDAVGIDFDDNYKVFILKDENPNSILAGKKCYITQGLISICNDEEITSIMLHEYGHYIKRYASYERKRRLLYVPFYFIVLNLVISSIVSLLSNPFVREKNILLTVSTIASFFLGKKLEESKSLFGRREHELIADSYAVSKGYGKELESAIRKIRQWSIDMVNKNKEKICKKKRAKTDEACNKVIEDIIKKVDEGDPKSGYLSFEDRTKNIQEEISKLNQIVSRAGTPKVLEKLYSKISNIISKDKSYA